MRVKVKVHNKVSAWFDELYIKIKIPMAISLGLEGNPLLLTYIEEHVRHSGKELLIGCGLEEYVLLKHRTRK